MTFARRIEDWIMLVMRGCRSLPSVRRIKVAVAALLLGMFFVMPCDSRQLNPYDQGSSRMHLGVQYYSLPLVELSSSGSAGSEHAADSIGAHLVVADDHKLLSTESRQRERGSILGRKLAEKIAAADHEELYLNEDTRTVHEAENSNSNSHVGDHRHHHHNRHQKHRRSAGHHEVGHHQHLPAVLKPRFNKSAVRSSKTEWNSLAAKKTSTVSWHKPRDEKYDQPTFHVDYSGPKTHPPKNN